MAPRSTQNRSEARQRRPYAPRMAPEQRREHLLDATLGVILQSGYSGVSMEAVARAAGVTRPVVYDHFANTGLLLQSLIEREERYSLEQLAQLLPGELAEHEPPELLAIGVRRFLDLVAERPATWTIILLPPAGTPQAVREVVERNRTRTLERIEHIVRVALARPEVPSDLDAELTARAIRDLSEEAARMLLTDPERFSSGRYERYVRAVMRLVWPGQDAGH